MRSNASFTHAVLQTRHLTVGIDDKIFCRQMDLSLFPGERLAILGCNGTGKSTLLSVLAGLRVPQEGEVLLDGNHYASLGDRKSALWRAWLPQKRTDAFAATVIETALVGRHPHLDRWGWESARDLRIVRDALAAVDLSADEQRDIQTLSGGERQRLAIAAVLAQQPRIFLLDEPLAHLDLKHQMAMLMLFSNTARSTQAAVVMVLHDPALTWRFCDRVLLMYGDGSTECGSTREMLSAERLSALYRHPLRIETYEDGICIVPR